MIDKEKELTVKKIENGTVIDHISKGKGTLVMKLLKVNSDTECYLLQNVESKKLERKDVLKIVDKYPTKEEVDDISLIAPSATIIYVKDWGIKKKYRVKLPDKIEGLIKCPNRFCITNKEKGVKTSFSVLKLDEILLQCLYCDTLVEHSEIENYIP